MPNKYSKVLKKTIIVQLDPTIVKSIQMSVDSNQIIVQTLYGYCSCYYTLLLFSIYLIIPTIR